MKDLKSLMLVFCSANLTVNVSECLWFVENHNKFEDDF